MFCGLCWTFKDVYLEEDPLPPPKPRYRSNHTYCKREREEVVHTRDCSRTTFVTTCDENLERQVSVAFLSLIAYSGVSTWRMALEIHPSSFFFVSGAILCIRMYAGSFQPAYNRRNVISVSKYFEAQGSCTALQHSRVYLILLLQVKSKSLCSLFKLYLPFHCLPHQQFQTYVPAANSSSTFVFATLPSLTHFCLNFLLTTILALTNWRKHIIISAQWMHTTALKWMAQCWRQPGIFHVWKRLPQRLAVVSTATHHRHLFQPLLRE